MGINKPKYSCVVWDWNGTIVDDVNTALLSVNDMLIKRSMSTITLQQYHSYLDTPISKFYEHLFDLSKLPFEVIQSEFNSGYNKYIPKNPLNSGALEIMQLLSDCGVSQAIVSSSNQRLVEEGAKKLGVAKFMKFISGSGDHFVGSKVERAVGVISRITTDFSKVIAVGDTLHDCELANEIGADCVLLSTGHQSKQDLLTTGKPVIDNLSELKDYIF